MTIIIKAIKIDSKYVSAYNNRGIVKPVLGDRKGALHILGRSKKSC
jgi:hypothetical protein